MQWVVAIMLLLIGLACLPSILSGVKRSGRKSRFGGFTAALGMTLASVLDAPKAAAVENIDKRKELGDPEAGEGGEKLD